MENSRYKNLIKQGEAFEKAGDLEKSLECYSKAFDCLIAAAKVFAESSFPGGLEAILGKGRAPEEYMQKFSEFLKRDKNACIISNNMGVLFAKIGDNASARVFFEQSIDLTPKGVIYNDPHVGLQVLENKK